MTESDLDQFSGTEHWFEHWSKRLIYTDGIKYMADEGGAHWLVDAIASHQPKVRGAHFQIWELTVTDASAVLTCREDTDLPALVTQNIEFTDFPLKRVKLYVVREHMPVLMLPSEY